MLIALTGRTGSGCTTAANILSREFGDIPFVPDQALEPERRKLKVVQRLAQKRWVPFRTISVSTVIASFFVQEPWGSVDEFLRGEGVPRDAIESVNELWHGFRGRVDLAAFITTVEDRWSSGEEQARAISLFDSHIPEFSADLKRRLAGSYHHVFQRIGDNLRSSGSPLSSVVDPSKLFALTRRLVGLIEAYREVDKKLRRQTRLVIDAVRNPLELVYLRDRFTPFFAIAITAEDSDRRDRLFRVGFSAHQVEELDEKEYPEKKKHLSDYPAYVSQNLQNCIQKADIFINNPGRSGETLIQATKPLAQKLVRYITLAMHPGLVTPTRDERCMQIAFVAKLNSGCISRQVGAAVADKNHSIKAVGWNDVAKGQVPCLLRDVGSLASGDDDSAFSNFELRNEKFREKVLRDHANRGALSDRGLPCPYCFKDAYNTRDGKDEKNQVHTRSLHAEENAFLQLAKFGNSGIEGGHLYTTASPCELCSKKAFQLGISEVVFVDPYPGISSSHVLGVGPEELRPRLRLFSGAVGNAYHRLYEAILPIKDEYRARMESSSSGLDSESRDPVIEVREARIENGSQSTDSDGPRS